MEEWSVALLPLIYTHYPQIYDEVLYYFVCFLHNHECNRLSDYVCCLNEMKACVPNPSEGICE